MVVVQKRKQEGLLKLHWSTVPSISAPPPETVHATLLSDAKPASAGAPDVRVAPPLAADWLPKY